MSSVLRLVEELYRTARNVAEASQLRVTAVSSVTDEIDRDRGGGMKVTFSIEVKGGDLHDGDGRAWRAPRSASAHSSGYPRGFSALTSSGRDTPEEWPSIARAGASHFNADPNDHSPAAAAIEQLVAQVSTFAGSKRSAADAFGHDAGVAERTWNAKPTETPEAQPAPSGDSDYFNAEEDVVPVEGRGNDAIDAFVDTLREESVASAADASALEFAGPNVHWPALAVTRCSAASGVPSNAVFATPPPSQNPEPTEAPSCISSQTDEGSTVPNSHVNEIPLTDLIDAVVDVLHEENAVFAADVPIVSARAESTRPALDAFACGEGMRHYPTWATKPTRAEAPGSDALRGVHPSLASVSSDADARIVPASHVKEAPRSDLLDAVIDARWGGSVASAADMPTSTLVGVPNVNISTRTGTTRSAASSGEFSHDAGEATRPPIRTSQLTDAPQARAGPSLARIGSHANPVHVVPPAFLSRASNARDQAFLSLLSSIASSPGSKYNVEAVWNPPAGDAASFLKHVVPALALVAPGTIPMGKLYNDCSRILIKMSDSSEHVLAACAYVKIFCVTRDDAARSASGHKAARDIGATAFARFVSKHLRHAHDAITVLYVEALCSAPEATGAGSYLLKALFQRVLPHLEVAQAGAGGASGFWGVLEPAPVGALAPMYHGLPDVLGLQRWVTSPVGTPASASYAGVCYDATAAASLRASTQIPSYQFMLPRARDYRDKPSLDAIKDKVFEPLNESYATFSQDLGSLNSTLRHHGAS